MIMVDELHRWPTKIRCFKAGSCHLMTDGPIDELHAFAEKIGLKRKWFQNDDPRPDRQHYDLTPKAREAALKAGAVFVPAKQQARARIARQLGVEP